MNIAPLSSLHRRFKRSRLFAFNLANRDAWIAQQAEKIRPGSDVLDVGAGSCPYRPLFMHCNYQAQDFGRLENMSLRDGRYGSLDYIGDAASIPVADATFDVVLCTEVLEHHPEPVRVIEEIARVLRPGGILLLTAPLGSGLHQEPFHYYGGFTPYWYRTFLPKYGFAKLSIEPNAGGFMFYAQESLRFITLSRPFFGRILPTGASIIWAPIWLVLFPVLALVIPLVCMTLDRFDVEPKFTVGYHVRAIKAPDQRSENSDRSR